MGPVIRRKLSSPVRNRVTSLHNVGKSLSEIADIIGRARTNVQRIIAKYKQYGHIERGKKTGWPHKTTPKEDRQIIRRSLMDRFEPIATIARELKVGSDKTPRSLVSRMIKQAGLHIRISVFKSLISEKNQKRRVQFAQQHIVWTDDKWSRVHFSDESKFNVIGSDRRSYMSGAK